jgi:hypothetical protein
MHSRSWADTTVHMYTSPRTPQPNALNLKQTDLGHRLSCVISSRSTCRRFRVRQCERRGAGVHRLHSNACIQNTSSYFAQKNNTQNLASKWMFINSQGGELPSSGPRRERDVCLTDKIHFCQPHGMSVRR